MPDGERPAAAPRLAPSPLQGEALRVMHGHGGELHCWPGGYWTWPGCPLGGWQPTALNGKGQRPPEWHVSGRIVRALIDMGAVEPVGAPDHLGRHRQVRLTDWGKAFACQR